MLREATIEDAEAISNLEGELFPDNCLNEKSIRDELLVSRGWVWEESGILGYAIARWDDPIDLLRIGVSKDFQGGGIGRKLLRRVLHEAYAVNRDVILTVLEDNIPARVFYMSEEFQTESWMPQAKSLIFRWQPCR